MDIVKLFSFIKDTVHPDKQTTEVKEDKKRLNEYFSVDNLVNLFDDIFSEENFVDNFGEEEGESAYARFADLIASARENVISWQKQFRIEGKNEIFFNDMNRAPMYWLESSDMWTDVDLIEETLDKIIDYGSNLDKDEEVEEAKVKEENIKEGLDSSNYYHSKDWKVGDKIRLGGYKESPEAKIVKISDDGKTVWVDNPKTGKIEEIPVTSSVKDNKESKDVVLQCQECGEVIEEAVESCSCGSTNLEQLYPKEVVEEDFEEEHGLGKGTETKGGTYVVKDREGSVYASGLSFKQAHDFVKDAKTQVKGEFIITSESKEEAEWSGVDGDYSWKIIKRPHVYRWSVYKNGVLQAGDPVRTLEQAKWQVESLIRFYKKQDGYMEEGKKRTSEAYDTPTTGGVEKDVRKVVAKGLADKMDAENIARTKRGKVVSDEDDPKKFMVVVGESRINEERQNFSSDVDVTLNFKESMEHLHDAEDYDLLTRKVNLSYNLDIEYRSWGIKNINPVFDKPVTISWSDSAGEHDIEVTGEMLADAEIEWEEGGYYGPNLIDVTADREGNVQKVVVWFVYITH